MRIRHIYTTFSFSMYVKIIFFRIFFLIVFYILLREYDESPAFILLLLVLDVIVILLIGYDKLIICEDRIVSKYMSFYKMILNPKGTTYFLNDIREAKLPSSPMREIIGAGRFVGLSNWYYLRLLTKEKDWASFYLEMKDEETIPIYTTFELGEINKIVGIINALIAEKASQQLASPAPKE